MKRKKTEEVSISLFSYTLRVMRYARICAPRLKFSTNRVIRFLQFKLSNHIFVIKKHKLRLDDFLYTYNFLYTYYATLQVWNGP